MDFLLLSQAQLIETGLLFIKDFYFEKNTNFKISMQSQTEYPKAYSRMNEPS